ncbi:unnamed protein product [Cyprideis torosa]|uniref:Uncharacterized protein n=1 Tax=Cyprideis torosa TaxID=163714 RepID=A0A7R8W6N3_9CRUS|nr:unnamed protein product [Cyprideis torosa]CAG0881504.1 unnamed protein product [Cyprideis torosa]
MPVTLAQIRREGLAPVPDGGGGLLYDDLLYCQPCEKQFQSRRLFRAHKSLCHSETVPVAEPAPEEPPPPEVSQDNRPVSAEKTPDKKRRNSSGEKGFRRGKPPTPRLRPQPFPTHASALGDAKSEPLPNSGPSQVINGISKKGKPGQPKKKERSHSSSSSSTSVTASKPSRNTSSSSSTTAQNRSKFKESSKKISLTASSSATASYEDEDFFSPPPSFFPALSAEDLFFCSRCEKQFQSARLFKSHKHEEMGAPDDKATVKSSSDAVKPPPSIPVSQPPPGSPKKQRGRPPKRPSPDMEEEEVRARNVPISPPVSPPSALPPKKRRVSQETPQNQAAAPVSTQSSHETGSNVTKHPPLQPWEEELLFCATCEVHFQSRRLFLAHTEQGLSSPKGGVKKGGSHPPVHAWEEEHLFCKSCEVQFQSRRLFLAHVENGLPNHKEEEPEDSEQEDAAKGSKQRKKTGGRGGKKGKGVEEVPRSRKDQDQTVEEMPKKKKGKPKKSQFQDLPPDLTEDQLLFCSSCETQFQSKRLFEQHRLSCGTCTYDLKATALKQTFARSQKKR